MQVKPLFTNAIFIDRYKFCEQFLKRSPKEHFYEIISKSDHWFQRRFSCSYIANSPHSLQPCLLVDQNFANNFLEGSLKKYFSKIISKSDPWFRKRQSFKNFFMSRECKKSKFQYNKHHQHHIWLKFSSEKNVCDCFMISIINKNNYQ